MQILRFIVILLVLGTGTLVVSSFAQDSEKSTLIRFVEDQLSSPNRQIRLNGLEGILSSDVRLESITIADNQGVWLTIVNPRLIWSRTALLRGRVDIESLTADRIILPRKPLPDESLPDPEATTFALPDLPVAVILEELSVPIIEFDPDVFGRAARISADGRIMLDDGSLDLDITVRRLDGPGGEFAARAVFDGEKKLLDLDTSLREPQGGIVATLLGLDGAPPVSLAIKGNAPIAELKVDLAFEVSNNRILDGRLAFSENDAGLKVRAEIGGPLSSVLPQRHKAFFGTSSSFVGSASFPKSGGAVLDDLRLDSGSIDLKASATVLADGFLSALNVDLAVTPNGVPRVTLPTADGDISIAGGGLDLTYDASKASDWFGRLSVVGLRAGEMAATDIQLKSSGKVLNPVDQPNRLVQFALDGAIGGISTDDPALSRALGTSVTLKSDGSWSNKTAFLLNQFQVLGSTFKVDIAGKVQDAAFDGDIAINADRLAAFSALAGRKLSGATRLLVRGQIMPFSGRFDLDIEGNTQRLAISDPIVDPLVAGETVLSGGIARTVEGIQFRRVLVASDAFRSSINGRFASDLSDLKADARIHDLAKISPNAEGPLHLNVELTGQQKPFDLVANLELKEGRLLRKPVQDLILRFDGRTSPDLLAGKLFGGGEMSRKPVTLAATIDVNPKEAVLSDFIARIGATDISGGVRRGDDGLVDGKLRVSSIDVGDLAALFLTPATGAVYADIILAPGDEGNQTGSAKVEINRLSVGDIRIGSADVNSAFDDLFGVPKIDAQITAASIKAGGIGVRSVSSTLKTTGRKTDFHLTSELSEHATQITTSGRIFSEVAQTSVTLDRLELQSVLGQARLANPSNVLLKDGITSISETVLKVGDGSVRVAGSAGEKLDLQIAITKLPLAIANAIAPDLKAAGFVSGTIVIGGTQDSPVATLKVTGDGLSNSQLATFGVRPLDIVAEGKATRDTLTLSKARLRNGQNIDIGASGAVSLAGGDIQLAIKGTTPLALAQTLLADRGTTLSGTARIDVALAGPTSSPKASGTISIAGASVSDPLSNLKLNQLAAEARLDGDRISIQRVGANLASGGRIRASGKVGLSTPMPLDISVELARARYTDAETFDTTISGKLAVSGSVADGPRIGGTLTLNKTEITIPESLPVDTTLLKVKHMRPPAGVRRTLARIRQAAPKESSGSGGGDLFLDITVDAPNKIFVRGRGLDAEIGGRVRLYGPISDLTPTGAFELRRGRLSIIGRRLDLTRSNLTLDGNLNPVVDIQATSQADDVEIYILVQGRALKPKVTFTSQPELPQDEVLALLVFGRAMDNLSPSQLIRLATIAAELTGGSSPGLVSGIRGGIGLDDLDIVQDKDGDTAVRAGKYVSDNVYLGVQAGKKRQEVTINLDLSKGLKTRGAVGSDGSSSVGIFFEKDY